MGTTALAAPQPPLPLASITQLAERLARRVARNPADFDDLQQLGLFEYHEAAAATPAVTNPFGFARTVLLRAMWRFYASPSTEEVSLDAAQEEFGDGYGMPFNLSSGTGDEDQAEMQEYLEHLEQACGPTARLIAENLISPVGDCAEAIVASARRKAEKQDKASAKHKKHQPRGVKGEIRLSHPIVSAAMGVSNRVWWAEMRKIREFTRAWLAAC